MVKQRLDSILLSDPWSMSLTDREPISLPNHSGTRDEFWHAAEAGGRPGKATEEAIGFAHPPTATERSKSIHSRDTTILEPVMTSQALSTLIFDDWGLYITESVMITDKGCEPFTTVPRELIVKR